MTHEFSGHTRVPDLVLERYRLGEMTPEETTAFERRLHGNNELRQRLQALEVSDDEIRSRYPPSVLTAHVKERLGARARETNRTFGAGVFGPRWSTAVALVSVLALAVLVGLPLLGPGDEPAERVKGLEPTLLLFRKTAEGSEQLPGGAITRAGDLIRVGYRAAGDTWGLILSVDGRGVVTRHLPREGTRAVLLSKESQVLLDAAYELDDAPRWECFYFITGSEPFDSTQAIDAAMRAATSGGGNPPPVLPLSMNVRQSSVLLIKEVVP